MALTSNRACENCHKAKVKCTFEEGALKCTRCTRLGLKCIPHVSRQGQGTRRRKKTKVKSNDNLEQALAISSAISTVCRPKNQELRPMCPQSSGVKLFDGPPNPLCPTQRSAIQIQKNCRSRSNPGDELCSGIDNLEIEDSLLCKSITNGMGKDHFGLNYLIREWVALAFSRRSFALLARASFVASKMKIPMDDIISNQSPFAAATDSQPMEFLARDLLSPKNERVTIGYPIELGEIPWELLNAVNIDTNQPAESVRNRWIVVRWTSQGISRFWGSPLFSRDFATVDEICEVFAANSGEKEVIDLLMAKSEKAKFAQGVFNLLFVNHKPNMEPFVIRNEYMIVQRKSPVPILADVIQAMKLIDLDSMIHYIEIQMPDNKVEHSMGDKTSSVNKREHVDVFLDNPIDEPILDDGIEFTDIEVTEEMEEFLKLIGGD